MEKYGTDRVSHNFKFKAFSGESYLNDSDCSEDYDHDPYFQENYQQTLREVQKELVLEEEKRLAEQKAAELPEEPAEIAVVSEAEATEADAAAEPKKEETEAEPVQSEEHEAVPEKELSEESEEIFPPR